MTSLNGIFSNGVNGMLAQTQAMGSVSDNIANIETTGYKRSDVLFSTMLGESDGPANYSATTTAPLRPTNQNGVAPFTRQLVDVNGAIHNTSNPLDLAISGPGMFVFSSDINSPPTNVFYGRAGNLSPLVPTTLNGGLGTAATTTVLTSTASYLANSNGQFLLAQAVAAPAPGQIYVPPAPPTDPSQLVPIQMSNQTAFPGSATTLEQLQAVIPASNVTTVSTPLSYFDSAGLSQPLTVTWSNPVVTNLPPAAPFTTWNVNVTDPNNVVVGTGTMIFDDVGTAAAGSSLAITATSTNPSTSTLSTSFTLDLSKIQMLGTATAQNTLATNTNLIQDGLPSGAFEGIVINPDGTVVGQYAGGASQILYQIPLATFASPNTLQVLAGNVYQPSVQSGTATFGFPGTQLNNLQTSALEESNVDLGASFTTLILTQQAYGASAQVLKVADEMTTTAAGLKR